MRNVGEIQHSEMERYFSYSAETGVDIQSFWRRNQETFPLLSHLARRILCIPASSLACERLFSHAGGIVTKKRNRLSSERVHSMSRSRINLLCLEETGLPSNLLLKKSMNN
jgi:hypothetical protein